MTAQPLAHLDFFDPTMKILNSYWYFKGKHIADFTGSIEAAIGAKPMMFADSGAHSARTKGVTLDLGDFANWCRVWDRQLTVISNLDVIGAPAATYRNQKLLETKYGMQIMPVFHTGEDWSWLERYLDEGYTYIALGKLLGNSWKNLEPWLHKAFRIAGDRAVFHGFGMTVWAGLREFPFYSVDSSSWGSGFRFGRVSLFDNGRWIKCQIGDKASVLAAREVIRDHGVAPETLLDRSKYHGVHARWVAGVAMKRAETWLRQRHGLIELPPSDHCPVRRERGARPREVPTPGFHMYLADTDHSHLVACAQGLAHDYRRRGIQ